MHFARTDSGSGPSSAPSTFTLNRLVEPLLSCMPAKNSARKWNGSSWISTSKPASPVMLKPAAEAYRCACAPNCTVFDVSAKYASHVSRGLSPVVRLTARRSTDGKPAGGVKP